MPIIKFEVLSNETLNSKPNIKVEKSVFLKNGSAASKHISKPAKLFGYQFERSQTPKFEVRKKISEAMNKLSILILFIFLEKK